MAFDAGAVKGTLELDAHQFLTELKSLDARIGSVDREVKEARRGFTAFGGSIAKTAATIGASLAGFLALRAAFRGITTGLKTASTDAADYELTVQKLSVSLAQAGAKGVAPFVEEMKAFASEIQKATSYSDGYVLEVSQLLTVLGVSQDKLQQYTKAVLDYSAATGTDAVNAARQFGKTFGGTLGELSESLPVLKSLTQEELQQGAAFEFVQKAFGGFAEEVANTSKGLSDQLSNVAGDFSKQVGAVINPFLDELKRAGIDIVTGLANLVNENRESIATFFQDLAIGALDFVGSFVESITTARLALHDFTAGVQSILPSVVGLFAELSLQVKELILAYYKFADIVPGLDLSEIIANFSKEVESARQDVDAMAEAFGDVTREAEGTRQKIIDQGEALESKVLPALEKAKEKVKGISTDFAKAGEGAAKVGAAVGGAAGNTAKLAEEATQARIALAAAADAAEDLDESTASAGANLGGITPAESRHAGGAVGLNLSDAFSAINTLQQQESLLRQSAFGPRFVQRAQSIVVANVRAAAQAQIDKAFKDFTEGLVDELNRAGIFNQEERQSFINERIAEAQRFGVLPKENAAKVPFGGATISGF